LFGLGCFLSKAIMNWAKWRPLVLCPCSYISTAL